MHATEINNNKTTTKIHWVHLRQSNLRQMNKYKQKIIGFTDYKFKIQGNEQRKCRQMHNKPLLQLHEPQSFTGCTENVHNKHSSCALQTQCRRDEKAIACTVNQAESVNSKVPLGALKMFTEINKPSCALQTHNVEEMNLLHGL